jgi:sugar (pentulose or hexulose) kinase
VIRRRSSLKAANTGNLKMYLLGIDVGTGGTRALVIDSAGIVVNSATEDYRSYSAFHRVYPAMKAIVN